MKWKKNILLRAIFSVTVSESDLPATMTTGTLYFALYTTLPQEAINAGMENILAQARPLMKKYDIKNND